MALRQAILIKDLDTAIQNNLPIVLLSPKDEQTSLTSIFDKDLNDHKISSENAKMRKLSEWAKPPYKDGKKYAHIETSDWNDFERKFKKISDANQTNSLYIEYEGYITHGKNTILNKETRQDLKKGLLGAEAGISLYSSPEIKISFLKLAFDKEKNMCVSLAYIENENDVLKQAYIHTPHTKQEALSNEYTDKYDQICNDL